MIYVWLELLIAVLSCKEVQKLIEEGKWKREDYWIPIWHTDWQSKWKNWNSTKVAMEV